jgi:hypothetical protein
MGRAPNSATPSGAGQYSVIQAMAPLLRVEASPVSLRDAVGLDWTIVGNQ